MHLNVAKEVAALKRMTMKELRDKYAEVFGEPTRAGNRIWLVKRIAWRLQALAEGDLSERARRRAAELANDADFRIARTATASTRAGPGRRASPGETTRTASRHGSPDAGHGPDPRLQGRDAAGAGLGRRLRVRGQRSTPRSAAVAKAITGAHWNGRLIFRPGDHRR